MDEQQPAVILNMLYILAVLAAAMACRIATRLALCPVACGPLWLRRIRLAQAEAVSREGPSFFFFFLFPTKVTLQYSTIQYSIV